jgi:SPP1 family predicted phage head-tail adaptor
MTAYGAGELSERVTFRRETSTPDGMGGYVKSFADVCTVWALVRPMSGREREFADAVESSANYFIVIYYRGDIRENDICLWRGRQMNIRNVKDRGPQNLYLEMDAEAGVAM